MYASLHIELDFSFPSASSSSPISVLRQQKTMD